MPPRDARMRVAISFAALFVKVTARIREGEKRSAAMRWTTAAVKVDVLPVPAPARTRIGPACAAASAWALVRVAAKAASAAAGSGWGLSSGGVSSQLPGSSSESARGSENLGMAVCSIDKNKFSARVVVGGEDREFGIEIEGAVRVARAVNDHAIEGLRAVAGFDIDKCVGEAVAGRRAAIAPPHLFGQTGEGLG